MNDDTAVADEPIVRPFEFGKQEALDRVRLRRLSPVLEVLAHRIAGALTSLLRLPVRVEIGDLGQPSWEQYINELPDPTFLASATVTPFGGRLLLHLPMALAMCVIEIRLGGGASDVSVPQRQLSEIEQGLVSEVTQAALAEIPPAFAPFLSLGVGAITTMTSSLFLQSSSPKETCLVVQLKLEIGDNRTDEATLCMPLSILLPILDALERMDRSTPEADHTGAETVRVRLLDTQVDVSVSFRDISMSPEELVSLAVGDVIGFHSDSKTPLLLNVAGVPFCEVVPTVQGKRLACMVIDDKEVAPQ